MQSQLKNIYTTSCATLCPLQWLEKAGDVQFNFDDVFIPLRAIDIDIQQKSVGGNCDFESRSVALINELTGNTFDLFKLHRTYTTR